MKKILFLFLIPAIAFSQTHTITSFSPTSAPVGATVIITGTNFSTTASSNIVYFGAVKAAVTAATSTQLTVTVPTGATYQPITVTVNGYTRYSVKPFTVTFPSSQGLDVSSFGSKVDYTTGTGTNPYYIAIGDIDGDGKPDLAVANVTSNTVSVFRNTSTSGTISPGSFATKVDFATGTIPYYITMGDIDCDGKLDLVVTNSGTSNTVSVFRNISTTGSISTSSFSQRVDISVGMNPHSVAIGDIDGDGKPDLAVPNYNNNTVSVLRNISSPGSIVVGSFATKIDFATGTSPVDAVIGDIDGDGKPDLAVTNLGSNSISVLRNTSTSGSITTGSLAVKVDFATGVQPYQFALSDIDNDGKSDFVVGNYGGNSISVLKNASTSGSITTGSFVAKVDFATGSAPEDVVISDVDGDGKPDIVVANSVSNTVSLFRNTSTTGSIGAGSFAAKVDLTTGTTPISVVIGDIDGDGKPDLSVANNGGTNISIFRSLVVGSSPVAYYPFNNNANDESGNGNHGTEMNGVAKTTDRFGNVNSAYNFDGLDDHILIGDPVPTVLKIQNEITLSAWVKITQMPADYSMIVGSQYDGTYSGASLILDATGSYPGHLHFQLGNGTWHMTNANAVLPTNTWVLVTAVRKANQDAQLYYNDQLQSSTGVAWDGAITYNSSWFAIGRQKDLIRSFSGSVDDIRIYNRALSSSEIDSLYHIGGWSQSPTVSSFTPTSGTIGSSVTITGTNFSTTTTNNIVYFGAVKATVTAATATQLTVTVPAGATYQPITVTVNGLTAYSNKPFIITFTNTGVVDANAFATKVDFTAGTTPSYPVLGDIDGDGKPDLVVTYTSNNTVSVYRNTSTSGSISAGSFSAKVDFATGSYPWTGTVGDIDGDGKLDLVVVNNTSNTVSIFRNTSTPGSITAGSFATKLDIGTGGGPMFAAIGDIDGDGKPDLSVTNSQSNTISVFRNIGTAGSLTAGSFAAKVDYATGSYPFVVVLTDIDGDGKTDLVVSNVYGNSVSLFRNTSTPGIIATNSFAAKVDITITAGIWTEGIAMGDIDGDSKPDLVAANWNNNTISVLKNISTAGSITSNSFAAKVDFAAGTSLWTVALGDINGDGKPDIAVSDGISSTVSVFKNTSSQGSIGSGSFATRIDFITGTNPNGVAIGDIDGDGKPDLALANNTSNTFSILRNTISSTATLPTISSFTPSTGSIGSSVTISGTNFGASQGTSTVKFGTTTASVTSWTSTQIIASVPSITAGNYTISVTTTAGTANSSTQFSVSSTTYPDPLPALYKTTVSTAITSGTIDYMVEENGILWMGGANGLIAKSTVAPSAGTPVSWTLSNSGISLSETIYSIEFASTTLGFAGTGSGKIYRTTDGGSTWSLVYNNVGATNFINIIKFFNSTTGIASGDGISTSNIMAFLYTTDGGTTWTNNNTYLFGATSPSQLTFPAAAAGYTTGNYNLSGKKYSGIFKTTNSGISWTFYTVGNTVKDSVIGSSCVEFRSSTVGMVVRYDSTVWKTTNGGTVWSKVGQLPRMGYGITFASTSIAYVAGASGLIAQVNYSNNTINAVLHDANLFFTRPFYSAALGTLYVPNEDVTRVYYTSLNPSSPLTMPTVINPSNGSQIKGNAVSFSWTSVSGATAYDVEIGTIISSSVKGTIYTSTVAGLYVDQLAPATTYQWRVRARSLTNSSGWSTLSSFTVPATQTIVDVIPATFPATPKSSTDYRLITIPTASPFNVESFLTGTSKEYRIFKDNGETPPNHLDEMNAKSFVSYGEGYWLIKKGNLFLNGDFDFPVPVNGVVTFFIKAFKWNIIGNPYPVKVKWSDVVSANGLSSNAVIYSYEGTSGYQQATVLEPYVGYYYYSNASSIAIPFPFSPTSIESAPLPAVSFNVVYSSSSNTDKTAFVGIDQTAQEGIDDFEIRKPPVFSDQGSIWFERKEWDGKNSRFASDVRPSLGDGQTWDFTLQQSDDETARLSLEGAGQLPEGYEVVFVNKITGVMHRTDSKNGVTIPQVQGNTPYSLIIGKQQYVRSQIASYVPDNFVLHQNYPNPFNPSTTIRFGLTSDANVQLKIYDLLGREVMQLVNQKLISGNHEYVLNAHNLASGTYIYSFRVTSLNGGNVLYSNSKKMTLIK